MATKAKAAGHEKTLYLFALVVRVVMILWGEWQDKHLEVKYTDIDYLVFTDAAYFLSQGGSPYDRATYRYTPVLAAVLWPTALRPSHPLLRAVCFAWGKVLFAATDLLVGYLIGLILKAAFPAWTSDPKHGSRRMLMVLSIWLLNPVTINVSTRGSADSIVAAMVLATVAFVLQGRPFSAGLMHGLAVHFKIYPIIFSPTYLAALGPSPLAYLLREQSSRPSLSQHLTASRLLFTLTSAATFLVLTAACTWGWGEDFLYHGLLYHLGRTDHRHNYSMYFYPIYLTYDDEALRRLLGMGALLPQAVLLLAVAVVLGHRDLPGAVAVQTLIFVAFNKVCTGQYFLWYLSIFPAALPSLLQTPKRSAWLTLAAWLASMLLWLACAYQLELRGRNTFFLTWLSSTLFFTANVALAYLLLCSHRKPVGKEAP